MALQDIIFRALAKAGFATKNDPLTWLELDGNFEILIDELLAIQAAAVASIAPYNPVTVYDPADTNYVSYLGNIYLFIGASPTSGVVPVGNPSTWQLSSQGALSHVQGTDLNLAAGSPFSISAAQIRGVYDNQIISGTYSQVAATKTANALRPGYWYYCTDKYVMIKAVANNKFDEQNCILPARNPDYQNTGGLMLEASTGDKTCVWSATGGAWWTQVLIDFPTSGARQNKFCIYKGKHYKNLTGTNTSTAPDADTTNWLVMALTDASYIIEIEKCSVTFDSWSIVYREDVRGNKIKKHSGAELADTFQFGNNKVYNNLVSGKIVCWNNQGYVFGNYVNDTSELTVNGNSNSDFDASVSVNCIQHSVSIITNNTLSITHNEVDDGAFTVSGNTGTLTYNYFRKNSSTPTLTNNEGTINGCIFERCGGLNIALTDPSATIVRTTIINSATSNPVLDLNSTNVDLYFAPPDADPAAEKDVNIVSNSITVGKEKVVNIQTIGGSLFNVSSSHDGILLRIRTEPASGGSNFVDTTAGNIVNTTAGALTDWYIDDGNGDYMDGYYMQGIFYVINLKSS